MELRQALCSLARFPASARRMQTAILPTRSRRRRPASVSTSIMNISPTACAVLLKVKRMRILQTQVYRGANLWAPMPVIRFSLDVGELAGRFTNANRGFYEKLTATLPTLREHECSTGSGDLFIERLLDGTSLGHVLQHMALEIQHMAGQRVDGSKTCLAIKLDDETTTTCDAIFQYEQRDVGLAAGQFAVRLLKFFLEPEAE